MGMMDGVQAAATGDVSNIPPELAEEMRAYQGVINTLLHSKETSNSVMEMLGNDPELTVPPTALRVDEMAAQATGGKVSVDARLAGGVFIVSELIDMGKASGQFSNDISDETISSIFQDTLQDYIKQGLDDGSIDPLELQQSGEQFMTPEQKQLGMQGAEATGVPLEGNPHQVVQNTRGMDKLRAQKEDSQSPVASPTNNQGGVL